MPQNTGRDAKIFCSKVEEKEGNLYFWIQDEKTEEKWVFYTSVEEEEMDIYYARDHALFIPQTHLDDVKLQRMSGKYQEFLQDRAREEAKEKFRASKLKRKK